MSLAKDAASMAALAERVRQARGVILAVAEAVEDEIARRSADFAAAHCDSLDRRIQTLRARALLPKED